MRFSSFNIVHLAIALFVLVLGVVLFMAVMQSSARDRKPTRNSSQLRGIHQGLVTYSTSNKEWFPGINELGEDEAITVEERFQILIKDEFFTPEYAISPSEIDSDIEPWDPDGGEALSDRHYSYAMLQVPAKEDGRRNEWRLTLNSQAIVISDRNTGTPTNPHSIHTDPGHGWAGSVLWNDNHVEFENGDCVFETVYDSGDLNRSDHLFVADGLFDALMIHSGN